MSLLRKGQFHLVPEHAVPDVVIGRDLQHLFRKKDLMPLLSSGFCLVSSTLGLMIAGCGHVTNQPVGGNPPAAAASSVVAPGNPGPSEASRSNSVDGISPSADVVTTSAFFAVSEYEEAVLTEMGENFWKLENIGIEPPSPQPDDDVAHERFRKTTIVNDEGRYEVRLPWKTANGEPPSNAELPTNLRMARGRLTSFQRAHQAAPDFLLKYGEGFRSMEADGIIERFDGAVRQSALLHFLAHHAVVKESSATTKVRSVFDGSAKTAGKPSINELLHRGPVLLPTMAAILVRVRLYQILLIADIAKAFLQVSLHPTDRSACAFLWLKDPLLPPTDDNLIYYRFRRVTFGLKPSPFLLGATIQMHLEKLGTPLAKEIWSNCYVDNVILGANSLAEALEKYRDSKDCFATAQMQLRQFASNCSEFNQLLPRDDAAELDNLTNLGYQWDVEGDTFRISLASKPAKGKAKRCKNKANAGDITQRLDPVGYLQPILLPAKLVIQEMWKLEAGWDTAAPPPLAEAWEAAVQHFEETTIVIPRRISAVPYAWLELHVYVDASKEAYGFATYLRTPAEKHFNVSLVYSRAKIKPLKEAERMTIPRMELMAFLLGARNAHFMADTLAIQEVRRIIIWSDSMIVLQQLRTPDKSKEVFVENRLNEIRALQADIRFETRYVNTTENPADLVSRGLPAIDLQSSDLWWHASPFLKLDEALWPPQPSVLTATPDASSFPPPMGSFCGVPREPSGSELEVSPWDGYPSQEADDSSVGGADFDAQLLAWRASLLKRDISASATLSEPAGVVTCPGPFTCPGFVSHFHAAVRRTTPRAKLNDHLVDIRTVGTTWTKVQRIHCYVLRAVAAFFRLRNLADTSRTPLGIDFSQQFNTTCQHTASVGNPTKHAYCGTRLYTVRDLQIAAAVAIWQTQQVYRPSQTERQQLNLVEHDGLLYVRGRLDKSSLAATTVTPLYLPRHSPLLSLICYEYHRANLHAGVTTTLANVRVRYWFTQGRRVVASAIRLRCADCRKLRNPPYSVPPWPVLPSARVNPSRPFSKVGVDYFGPVLLKTNTVDGNPSAAVVEKYYVCLFTCLCIRAVHCELVSDLTTEQFFHAFKRFTARRSFPDEVLSDNGTTFLAARQTIRTIIRRRRGQHLVDEPPTPAPARRVTFAEPISSRTRARKRTAAVALASAGNPADMKGNPFAMLLASQSDSEPAEELQSFFDANNVTWGTITDRAAWRGGTYERMIGLIKECLSKTLGRFRPTVDHYQTLLTQAEYIVNTRPLTYIHNSEREFSLVRPIDFLIPTLQGHQLQSYLEPAIDVQRLDDPDYAPANASDKVQQRLLRDLELATRLTDAFWTLWRDGYLIEQRRCFGKQSAGRGVHPAVGDIVLVYTDNIPRSHWRLALVLAIQPDEDGVIRTARIRFSGTGRETLRAVNHLYPLKPLLSEADQDDARDEDPADHILAVSAAPAGPSTPSTGNNIAQEKSESGYPLTSSTDSKESGNPRTLLSTADDDSTPIDEDTPIKDNTAPHNTEDRTSTEPISRATASSSRRQRGPSGRHGPAARRRW